MCEIRYAKATVLGKEIRMDKCMIHDIDILTTFYDLTTLACCCGHGRYKRTVVCKCNDGRIIEASSGKTLNRKKRFYKKDEGGYYFIPEVERLKS